MKPPTLAFVAAQHFALLLSLTARAAADEAVDFARDVRPILSAACFQCHGPDEKQRKSDLRLDTREGAYADLGGHVPFLPGKPEASEALRRMTSQDPEERMPPPDSGKSVTEAQIAVVKKWIDEQQFPLRLKSRQIRAYDELAFANGTGTWRIGLKVASYVSTHVSSRFSLHFLHHPSAATIANYPVTPGIADRRGRPLVEPLVVHGAAAAGGAAIRR